MWYDLRVIVEVNVVDDVMDVHVMHLGIVQYVQKTSGHASNLVAIFTLGEATNVNSGDDKFRCDYFLTG